MVEQSEVFQIANSLRAKGQGITVRAVRQQLKDGGSFTQICDYVRDWKKQEFYKGPYDLGHIPEQLQNLNSTLLIGLWKAASSAASEAFDEQRCAFDEAVLTTDILQQEAATEIDRLKDKLSGVERQLERLQQRYDQRGARLLRIRAELFWDGIMREVYRLLPANPAEPGMTSAEILPQLRPTARREAAAYQEDFTAGTLRKRMLTRVVHGKYFAERAGGMFARRVPAEAEWEMA